MGLHGELNSAIYVLPEIRDRNQDFILKRIQSFEVKIFMPFTSFH